MGFFTVLRLGAVVCLSAIRIATTIINVKEAKENGYFRNPRKHNSTASYTNYFARNNDMYTNNNFNNQYQSTASADPFWSNYESRRYQHNNYNNTQANNSNTGYVYSSSYNNQYTGFTNTQPVYNNPQPQPTVQPNICCDPNSRRFNNVTPNYIMNNVDNYQTTSNVSNVMNQQQYGYGYADNSAPVMYNFNRWNNNTNVNMYQQQNYQQQYSYNHPYKNNEIHCLNWRAVEAQRQQQQQQQIWKPMFNQHSYERWKKDQLNTNPNRIVAMFYDDNGNPIMGPNNYNVNPLYNKI